MEHSSLLLGNAVLIGISHQCFGTAYCLHLQEARTAKNCQSKKPHNPEILNCRQYRCEKLLSQKVICSTHFNYTGYKMPFNGR